MQLFFSLSQTVKIKIAIVSIKGLRSQLSLTRLFKPHFHYSSIAYITVTDFIIILCMHAPQCSRVGKVSPHPIPLLTSNRYIPLAQCLSLTMCFLRGAFSIWITIAQNIWCHGMCQPLNSFSGDLHLFTLSHLVNFVFRRQRVLIL